MIKAGIDTGITGGIAIFDDYELITVVDMPRQNSCTGKGNEVDCLALYELLNNHNVTNAMVEKVGAMPRDGKVSIFSFGRSFQAVVSVLQVLQIDFGLVTPQAWQKQFGIVGKKKIGLQGVDVVEKTYPEAPIRGPKGGLKDGRVDAVLIGLYKP